MFCNSSGLNLSFTIFPGITKYSFSGISEINADGTAYVNL
jgi:hypothetical protein